MSSVDYCIKNLTGIKDKNIKITNVNEHIIDGERIKEIVAKATDNAKCCPCCGSVKIIKNGHRLTKPRIMPIDDCRTEFKLYKQRFLCQDCGSTFGVNLDLVKPNQTLSTKLRSAVMVRVRQGLTLVEIATQLHCSATSVQRIINERVEDKRRMAVLPKHLCFDEFRYGKHKMAFICCDAEDDHELVTILNDRMTHSIVNYFLNRYDIQERCSVNTVCVDFNAQYASVIKFIFPNAQIVADRFHIVQLLGRAMDQIRTRIYKQLNVHDRARKILKTHWRLLHCKASALEGTKVQYMRGINEYLTQQDAIDLVIYRFPALEKAYNAYQDITESLEKRNCDSIVSTIYEYRRSNNEMDTAISTLKKKIRYVQNAARYDYSNGPIEGNNSKIKCLIRVSYGFRNFSNLLKRIECIFS